MMQKYHICAIFIPVFIFLFFGGAEAVFSSGNSNIESRIENKNRELERLQRQINETQNNLESVNLQKRSLSREIRTTEYTIRNLELNILGSEINIDKLSLEIKNLNNQLIEAEKKIEENKTNIAYIIRQIHEQERVGLLEFFLSGKSFTDSIIALGDLNNLQKALSNDIHSLQSLSLLIDRNIEEANRKKNNLSNERKNLNNRKEIIKEQKSYKEVLLKETRNKESAYQRQLSALEEKQRSVSDEIEDLEEILRKDININLAPDRGFFIKPFTGTRRITQGYGSTAFARTAYRTRFHNGLDYGMPIGTPVLAAASGRVFAVGDNGRYQYGRYVAIKHNDNLFTLYAHLSRFSVSVGEFIKQGDIIGHSGNTGFSTGPHLHFGIYQTMEIKQVRRAGAVPIGITIDPEIFF